MYEYGYNNFGNSNTLPTENGAQGSQSGSLGKGNSPIQIESVAITRRSSIPMQTNTFGFGVSMNATTAGPTVNTTAVHDQDVLLPPLTSLDALASSPFRLSSSPNVNGTSSSPGTYFFSSPAMGKGSAAYNPHALVPGGIRGVLWWGCW